ncbi:MAG: 16S rRNA (cytosine(1402)-N(4))-methyltransferase RsmH [Deltaproteobacteria bacterium]|jgi:16S rRNA (cytosine1402-N4)-methyltransferase|nr:16S rRNA (cytosine(1402)-N(4))-methyltransferase RsmH [Deltaproteobacteria bacterium]
MSERPRRKPTAKKPERKNARSVLGRRRPIPTVESRRSADWPEALESSAGEGFSWSAAFGHQPVLLAETLDALNVKPDGFYVDATLGGGGHSRAILERLDPDGRLLALDLDEEPLAWARAWSGDDQRFIVRRLNFARLPECLAELGLGPADGLLADLGLNSRQISASTRGFSFSREGPLDMRLDRSAPLTAAEVVNQSSEEVLADLFFRFGEERAARRLARAIVEAREEDPIETTVRLAEIAERTLGFQKDKSRLHPATKMFMSLRLKVNGEMDSLERFLGSARSCLKTGGRLAVISFHSLEDRMVKLALRDGESAGDCPWRLWRRKAIKPGVAELLANPRARSARLRAAEAV